MNSPEATVDVDVAVIGGGLGGVAAALAAARAGRSVVLTDEYGRIGGQVTTQALPALDEHPHIESFGASASYRAFRDAVRARHGGVANPGAGWVSRLCFEPAVAQEILDDLLAEAKVTVLTGRAPVAATVRGGRVHDVTLADGTVIAARVFCDATERGDLAPLAGFATVHGSEGRDAYGEPDAVPGGPDPAAQQSFTWCALVEHHPGEEFPGAAPAGYADLRHRLSFDIAGWDGGVHRYRMFTDGPDGKPPFWTYRRLRATAPELVTLNWAANDCAGQDPLGDPAGAERAGRELTAAFVHWLRTEAPREDGGRGFPGLRLAPEAAGTPDGYAEAPYLRESRRIVVDAPVTGHDLEPVAGRARARHLPGSLGVTWYHVDLHERTGHPTPVYRPTAPFTIPAAALVPRGAVNLLAAAKNLGATQIAAAAYRVHHGEWAVGEAAGTLAARCATDDRPVGDVLTDPALLVAVQRDLVADGVPLAWVADVPAGDPRFAAVHLAAAHGALEGERAATLAVDPDRPAGPADAVAVRRAAAALGADPSTVDTARAFGAVLEDITA
ncbi:FAD-dependent oxidoreductase [Micromonospora endolithica]|uniref:FAD-dependent oxidoreductase n=1 Tax=Micromonospora endolithica TaxID=230091 RepID=A0A3A9YWY0_9ACTN|nr:FAD-dependent oxidoreductase [Micromonospora endolithica]RKN40571.1 FAD-dependent oxidoreductase [Micromonospora endolithica]TWJ21648.1 FAD dependent oxidoreductase [Micromonospora endolithica]